MKMPYFFFFLICSCLYSCSQERTVLLTNSVEQQIDSLIEAEMEERKIPGLTIAVIKNDQVVYKKAFGVAVIEHQVPAKIETVYELASLTKQFVAAGILILVQEGKLNLDDPIEHYLDQTPEKWQNITVRQLLSHTAGFPPQAEEFTTLKKNWPKYVSREMMMESALADSMYASPGEVFRYTNVGFFLACALIEQIYQTDFKDFFLEKIFDPLEMNHTFFQDPLKITPHRAEGYSIKDGKLVRIWREAYEEMAGGWGVFSNIDDLIKWIHALDHNAILRPQVQDQMFKRISLRNGEEFRYGLGWFLPERNGQTYYYHNGITGPEILKIPDQDLSIILLSNLGNNNHDEAEPWGISDKLVSEILFPGFAIDPESLTIPLKDLEKLTGTYQFNYGKVVFSIEEGQLFMEDKYGKDPLAYKGDSIFSFLDYAAYFHFLEDKKVLLSEDTWEDDVGYKIQ